MAKYTSKKKGRMMVAAIDFGTTFSGYAFSFKTEYEENPNKVTCNQNWVAGSMGLLSLKAPTCVLFDENQEFQSFGYEAEDDYVNLALDGEHTNVYFFKRFKMKLHGKKITRDLEIEDDNRKTMPAKKVFGEIIKYLKNHLLKELETRGNMIENSDIHWILTVPAIWTDSAKQFMREASYLADIDGDQLSIGLEPEAASLFCQLPTSDIQAASTAAMITRPGEKYMVLDLGGGTADITVHEKQADRSLKELHKPSGGPWGGTKVDDDFNQLLIKIVGAEIFMKFCEKYKSDKIDMERELETKKRTIKPASKGKITVKVPVSLPDLYREERKEDVNEAIANSPFDKKIDWMKDKMRIDAEIFKGLFKTCCREIPNHVKQLLGNPEVKGTNIFVMVGGFSESQMIQDAMKKAIPKGKFIVPGDAGSAVVKGAVIFGHDPVAINPRVAKYTYGINISPAFDPSYHPEDHRVKVGEMDRCRDVFKRYIQVGDTVLLGEAKSGKHIALKSNQEEMLLKIYVSPNREPQFVDEEDVDFIGKLIVPLPNSQEKTRVEVRMMFGETELMVEAEELTHNKKCRAYFDFL